MPIRPENKKYYLTDDFFKARQRVRHRAGYKCEKCGVKNGDIGYRDMVGNFHTVTGPGDGKCDLQFWEGTTPKVFKIVCTVAHLDHDPKNNDLENLRYWCQRCHNRYDAKTRASGIKRRRREEIKKTQTTLKIPPPAP